MLTGILVKFTKMFFFSIIREVVKVFFFFLNNKKLESRSFIELIDLKCNRFLRNGIFNLKKKLFCLQSLEIRTVKNVKRNSLLVCIIML